MIPNFRNLKGFTLLELVVTMVVLAIVAVMAIPSFMTQIRKHQLYNDVRELVEVSIETRSEAVFRRSNRTLALSEIVDATAFRTWSPSEHVQWANDPDALEYNLLGFLVGDGQCIELEHRSDSSIKLAVTFNKNGSVLSRKDRTSCAE